jgi:hypothetical protein
MQMKSMGYYTNEKHGELGEELIYHEPFLVSGLLHCPLEI